CVQRADRNGPGQIPLSLLQLVQLIIAITQVIVGQSEIRIAVQYFLVESDSIAVVPTLEHFVGKVVRGSIVIGSNLNCAAIQHQVMAPVRALCGCCRAKRAYDGQHHGRLSGRQPKQHFCLEDPQTSHRESDQNRKSDRRHVKISVMREFALGKNRDIQKGQQRSEEHTSELQSLTNLVCRLLLEKKKKH